VTRNRNLVGIYDFELFPYALGDVLTWNVRTAMRCEELERDRVDIYICADERRPAGIYQRGLVNPKNFDLFFSELYSAFGTHPKLGSIHIFREREALLDELEEIVLGDAENAEALEDYVAVLDVQAPKGIVDRVRRTLGRKVLGSERVRGAFGRYLPPGVKKVVRKVLLPDETALNQYFIKYIHSHESINAFAAKRGGIPLLTPALGCVPDVDELIEQRLSGKKIVPFHLRMRRLDFGYGGEHSYARDSDFLEWYDFLRRAASRYPEVEFIALGRLQEKPLELLRLPNVTSLRVFGMGLGHELTLMLKSDLFIGTSSGFAALANFSAIPYFITKMTVGSCHAYAIPEGAERLPFATENQKLVYAQESSELLMSLLEEGLELPRTPGPHRGALDRSGAQEIDIRGWLKARTRPEDSAATTSRFYVDDRYRREETAFLLLPKLEQAKEALLQDKRAEACAILQRLGENFPDVCANLPQHHLLQTVASRSEMGAAWMRARLDTLDVRMSDVPGRLCASTASESTGWRPNNWVVNGGSFRPLAEEPQPALMLRATGPNCYWHTERFVSSRSDGRICVHLDAKNSEAPSRHQVWIFEDRSYRPIGDLVVDGDWRAFEIFITTRPGSVLELQIDVSDDWQWMSIRNVRVTDGGALPLVQSTPVPISMASWTGEANTPSDDTEGGVHNYRQWLIGEKKGYVQTPVLPKPGDGGLLIFFEARTDTPATAFTSIYLFEGDTYRTVAQYAFGPEWQKVSLLLEAKGTAPLRLQVDYPELVGSLSIRECLAVPVSRGDES
jgi:hypothetical protein